MGIRLLLILAITCLASAANSVLAQSNDGSKNSDKHPRLRVFELMDRNSDGKLQIDEHVAGSIGKAAEKKREEFSVWDLDQDGSLSFEEFKRRGVTPEKKKVDPARVFKQRDRNVDGVLDLKEYLGNRKDEALQGARFAFFRQDANEDQKLSVDEFLDSRNGQPLSGIAQFRQRDANDDGELSLSEFLSDRKKEPARSIAEVQFSLFDYEGDGVLSFDEFAMMPQTKPDLEAQFRGRDKDGDGKLSLTELSLFRTPQMVSTARRGFRQFDLNNDNGLDLEEFKSRQAILDKQRVARNSLSAEEWLTYGLISIDAGLVLYGVFWVSRWLNRPVPIACPIRPGRLSEGSSDSSGVDAESETASTPELATMDDFQIL